MQWEEDPRAEQCARGACVHGASFSQSVTYSGSEGCLLWSRFPSTSLLGSPTLVWTLAHPFQLSTSFYLDI